MSLIEKLGITPGPWEADCRTGCFVVDNKKHNCFSGVSDNVVVYQSGRGEKLHEYKSLTREQKLNAKFIAASPEMFNALLFALQEHGKFNTHWPAWTGIAMIAIEKATGKSWEEIKTLMEEER